MTADPCALCGCIGHLPKDCDWPKDTDDEPEAPQPAPEPDYRTDWVASIWPTSSLKGTP